MSVDPVDFMSSGYDPRYVNRYAYAGNDPINSIDPDGQFFEELKLEAKLLIGRFNERLTRGTDSEGNITHSTENALDNIEDGLSAATKVPFTLATGGLLRPKKVGGRIGRGGCCFVAGTLVETENGLHPIEDIKVGDLVLSRNPETGETAFKEVTAFIPRHDRIIWTVTLSGTSDTSESFETTDEHPWWVIGEFGAGSWKRTDELTAGMIVTTADNQIMTIVSVINTERMDGTYNLTVADFETYFVGRNKILVHNCKKNVNGNTEVGDNVKTFENSPEDFTNVGGGRFKDKKTGFIQTKSNSSHPPRPGGEIKSGAKKGEAPRPGKKITITGGAQGGCVLRKTGC